MCKYGYLGAWCTGAHAANAKCRAFTMVLVVHYTDGTQFSFNTTAAAG